MTTVTRRSSTIHTKSTTVQDDHFAYKEFLRNSITKEDFIKDKLLHDEIRRRFNTSTYVCHFLTCDRKQAEFKLKAAFQVKQMNGLYLTRACSKSDSDFVISMIFDNHVFARLFDVHFRNWSKVFGGIENVLKYYHESKGLVCLLADTIGTDPVPAKYRIYGISSFLHKLCSYGQLNLVQTILNSPQTIDIDERDDVGDTALHIASSFGHDEIVQILLEKGANLLKRDEKGSTMATMSREFLVVVIIVILDAGAEINAVNLYKSCPLHEASAHNSFACVSLLLEMGATPFPRDEQRRTPFDLAMANNSTEVVRLYTDFKFPDPGTKREEWFHGSISKVEAKNLLVTQKSANGKFLIRERQTDEDFVLSLVCNQKMFNYEIKKNENGFFSIGDGPLFDSLEQVVAHYTKHRDRLATRLGEPVTPQHAMNHTVRGNRDESISKNGKFSGVENNVLLTNSEIDEGKKDYDVSKICRYVSKVKSESSSQEVPNSPGLPILSKKDLHFHHKLGEGEFGVVYEGTLKLPNHPQPMAVAIKKLKSCSPDTIREFTREASIMDQLKHHCIVRIYGIVNEGSFMMVNELLPHGSILSIFRQKGYKVSIDHIKKWATQIADALNYMEAKRFVHRDLAARNVLVASYNQVKVSDFGLSRSTVDNVYEQRSNDKIPIKWYSPESIEYGRFTSKSDVWSYGVTLWEMFSYGKEPYKDMSGTEVYQFIKEGNRLNQPSLCPTSTYRIMKTCWLNAESQRPTFTMLVNYFANDNQFKGLDRLLPSI
ncbi:hypothetical protein ACOME3_010203 [Neoechinorhynchus agilis]